jgi:hypothetical protein
VPAIRADSLAPRTHARPPAPACLFAAGFPVDELAMNFPSPRIDHGYLEVLVVTQALVTEMLGKRSAVLDCFNVGVELDSNPVSQWNAIFHIEEECLHRRHLVCSVDRAPSGPIGRVRIGSEMKRELF